MKTDRELMQQALEALRQCEFTTPPAQRQIVKNALAALNERLAQPEQEPTGCSCRWDSEGDRVVTCVRHEGWLEVVAEWADRARDAEKKLKALNTSPPQRTWVGLTDEEAFQICVDCGCLSEDWLTLLDAIEAKLRSKNT